MLKKNIKILGIETSCDETAAAVIEIRNQKILSKSNVISSQVKVHAKYGGIVPEVAARHHAENIIFVLQEALKSEKLDLKSIDAIAVTNGPGLITSLIIGFEAAKTLAFLTNKPLIPVNHLAGHIYANFINEYSKFQIPNPSKIFPAICLIVSGGHTELVLMKDFENFKKIGQTLDDAAGECFDKVAKILKIGYPGGPVVAAEAAKFKMQNSKVEIKFPRPMINSDDFNFSFSGLKTAVLYKTQSLGDSITRQMIPAICQETQQSIIDVLISKTIKAAKKFKIKSIILGGGVVANQELRRQFSLRAHQELADFKFYLPESIFCTDNAAMVAVAGYFKLIKVLPAQWLKKFDWRKIKVDSNLEI